MANGSRQRGQEFMDREGAFGPFLDRKPPASLTVSSVRPPVPDGLDKRASLRECSRMAEEAIWEIVGFHVNVLFTWRDHGSLHVEAEGDVRLDKFTSICNAVWDVFASPDWHIRPRTGDPEAKWLAALERGRKLAQGQR